MRVFVSILCALFVSLISVLCATPTSAHTVQQWHWPVAAPHEVVRGFDPPEQRWLAGHRGVDLRVSCGQKIFAPSDGTVTLSRRVVDKDVVVISHDHRRSTFSPASATVPVGSVVALGQEVAVVSEECDGSVHWGVKVGRDEYRDPLEQLVGVVVLKPWPLQR